MNSNDRTIVKQVVQAQLTKIEEEEAMKRAIKKSKRALVMGRKPPGYKPVSKAGGRRRAKRGRGRKAKK